MLQCRGCECSTLCRLCAEECRSCASVPSLDKNVSNTGFQRTYFSYSGLLKQRTTSFQVVDTPIVRVFLFPRTWGTCFGRGIYTVHAYRIKTPWVASSRWKTGTPSSERVGRVDCRIRGFDGEVRHRIGYVNGDGRRWNNVTCLFRIPVKAREQYVRGGNVQRKL